MLPHAVGHRSLHHRRGHCGRHGTGRHCWSQRFHYYVSIDQYTRTWGNGMVLRLREDPALEGENVRKALQRAITGSSYLTALPLREVVHAAQRSWRLGATLFAAFGVLALVVAAVGLYGVIGG